MEAPTKNESRIIKFMILLGIFSVINFLYYFFQPENAGNTLLFFLLSVTILYSSVKKLYMWYNYSNISIPKSPEFNSIFKVDILTTYFPGEPYQMTITTLDAINNITYPHTTYLCDEANDPFLKKFCKENGIRHITRDNRIDAKAGNINNALKKYATGDVCVILDPDHIPEPNFLDPILPYFENPDIGFVQIVQSYYNFKETLVSRGAAEQTFQFYGPMMMTLNSYGAVNAIGANCVFRRTALDSIGGHAPGLCEDMHTAMLLYSKGWKAVYLPEVLARGLAPSNLTNFFKQQLKWSRGTFDLLVKVYPKIFKNLTNRQKIHYGILPLHYLGGIICLINFLIPVLSLLFSINPWKGNIIDFGLVLIPVAASSLLIRTYIQKWVIEKKERGFHVIGGLLHINTWWIYIVALIYTIINKKVPYLPTPKEDEWNTNLKLIVPNFIVALISIFAIIYGLKQDLTPFSLMMAGFAFFNALIMIFGIYLTFRVTNHNRILKTIMGNKEFSFIERIKQINFRIAGSIFSITRKMALLLLLAVLIISTNYKNFNDLSKWQKVESPYSEKISNRYLGIFHPLQENGLSDIQEINLIENQQNVNFDIVSFYLAWNKQSNKDFPHELMISTYEKNALPMITWEPWIAKLAKSGSSKELKEGKKAFKYIAEGDFDDYILDFVKILKSYDKPIFLRFGHEFDNPQYPWSQVGDNSPEEFIAAWKHIHELIKSEGAQKIMLVWNPWKAETMADYYPGDEYVDWIGITSLNYDTLNSNGKYYSFADLYRPFRDGLFWLTRKPVMLAEFGSLNLENRQQEWITNAMDSINANYDEISAIIAFNSAVDKNIPGNKWYSNRYLDWTTDSMDLIGTNFPRKPKQTVVSLKNLVVKTTTANPITKHDIKGVHYKKGEKWRDNYYGLTKNVLIEDFGLMKEVGINTIQFTGGNIYDYNILKYSEKFDLKVIYEFDLDNSIDFIDDQEKLNELREHLIAEVESLKENQNIIGYSFKYDLEHSYTKPLLFNQQTAYLNWLYSIISKIKTIDPKKSLVIELKLDRETISNIKKIQENLPIDSYGLLVDNPLELNKVLNFSKNEGISIYISNLIPELLIEDIEQYKDLDIILTKWQDERKTNLLTFDGLVDFNGNKKQISGKIKNIWTETTVELGTTSARILKPSKPLYPNEIAKYHAVLYLDNKWVLASQTKLNFYFEWKLIKKDIFGNDLAIKKMGTGAELNLRIPEGFQNYELMLIVKKNDSEYVISSKSNLHTPLQD